MTGYAVGARRSPPAACWGMAVFIASEATLFAAGIATYFYLRLHNPAWPLPGDPGPKLLVPALLVLALVATSVPMRLSSRAVQGGRLPATRAWLLVALAVQIPYLVWAGWDYRDQLDRLPAGTDAYSSVYYTLLGLSHLHVLLGVLFNLWLLARLATGLTTYRRNGTQAVAWYWLAVNAITVVVYLTLFSARI
jgi:cytochrome c oxidase subunit III